MGGINSRCNVVCSQQYNGSQFEVITIDHKYRDRQDSVEGETKDATQQKSRNERDSLKEFPSDIRDEHRASNLDNIPKFVQEKLMHTSVVSTRSNRFVEDIETEVRSRIKQIQEELNQQKLFFQKHEQQQSHSSPQQKEHHNQTHQTKPSFNLVTSIYFKSENQEIEYSNSQESQNKNTSNKQEKSLRTQFSSKLQKKAFEKLASEYYSNDMKNSNCRLTRSVRTKGILKRKQKHHRCLTGSQRRVRFSNDTHFKSEREVPARRSIFSLI